MEIPCSVLIPLIPRLQGSFVEGSPRSARNEAWVAPRGERSEDGGTPSGWWFNGD